MRRSSALVLAAMLALALAPALVSAAKPPKPITVTITNIAGCDFDVRASWDRPLRGQAILTLNLVDRYGGYLYAIIDISPTATSGSAIITAPTVQNEGALFGRAYINRSFDDPQKPYQNLAYGVSADLASTCRVP